MPQEMTIEELARLKGVKRRTVERWLRNGLYDSYKDGWRRVVIVPDEVVSESEEPEAQELPVAADQSRALSVSAAVQLATLTARCQAQEAELTYLRGLVSQVLQQRVADTTARPGLWSRLKAYVR